MVLDNKEKRIRLTSKDYDIISLVDIWGTLTEKDLLMFYDLKSGSTIRWRMNRLVKLGLIKKIYIPLGFHIYASKDCTTYNLNQHNHNLKVKKIAKSVIEKGFTYKTDRQMKSELGGSAGVRVPDLIINDTIAIEVELSNKSLARLRDILDSYNKSSYEKIIYYCGTQSIKARIDEILKKLNIKKIQTTVLKGDSYG